MEIHGPDDIRFECQKCGGDAQKENRNETRESVEVWCVCGECGDAWLMMTWTREMLREAGLEKLPPNTGTVECHTCHEKAPAVRSVKLRNWSQCNADAREISTLGGGQWTQQQLTKYMQYKERHDYRRAFVCERCYSAMDALGDLGTAVIGGTVFGLAGESRGGKAAIYNRRKWLAFQRKQAAAMGIA